MPRNIPGHGWVSARYPPPWSTRFPASSSTSALTPGNANVADPGLVVVSPGSGEIMMPPVIQDVFRDLIANARKYTPPGGEISAGLLQLEDELRLVVEDNGCGIAATDLPHIFEPMFSTKTFGEGTGLGMTIVQNIVR